MDEWKPLVFNSTLTVNYGWNCFVWLRGTGTTHHRRCQGGHLKVWETKVPLLSAE